MLALVITLDQTRCKQIAACFSVQWFWFKEISIWTSLVFLSCFGQCQLSFVLLSGRRSQSVGTQICLGLRERSCKWRCWSTFRSPHTTLWVSGILSSLLVIYKWLVVWLGKPLEKYANWFSILALCTHDTVFLGHADVCWGVIRYDLIGGCNCVGEGTVALVPFTDCLDVNLHSAGNLWCKLDVAKLNVGMFGSLISPSPVISLKCLDFVPSLVSGHHQRHCEMSKGNRGRAVQMSGWALSKTKAPLMPKVCNIIQNYWTCSDSICGERNRLKVSSFIYQNKEKLELK